MNCSRADVIVVGMVKEETAAMDVKQEVADGGYEGDQVFCCDEFATLPALQDVAVMDLQGELAGGMQDDICLWDADALFPDADALIAHQATLGVGGGGDEKPSEDITVVFLEWLTANKELISPDDFRRIKLKKSTVESAVKQLGGGREGLRKLVKPVLKWVEDHYLQRKRNIAGHCLQRQSNHLVCRPPAPTPAPAYADVGGEKTLASAAKEARKTRMARMRQIFPRGHPQYHRSSPESESTQHSPIISGEPNRTPNIKGLKLLLRKVLRPSDIKSNRISLPKTKAEAHLPELVGSDGISIQFKDIGTSLLWTMRYRYWLHNQSKMYVLENTCEFLRSNGLQQGDFIVLYSDVAHNSYLILGVRSCPGGD